MNYIDWFKEILKVSPYPNKETYYFLFWKTRC